MAIDAATKVALYTNEAPPPTSRSAIFRLLKHGFDLNLWDATSDVKMNNSKDKTKARLPGLRRYRWYGLSSND